MVYTRLRGWRKTVSKLFCVPQRVILALMGFLAIANAYTMRVSLSLAITEMVAKPNSTDPNEAGKFHWDQELQGMILSSFYIGYMLTHIPGGILAERFGGKWTLGLGILSTAAFTVLTPITVEKGGAYGLIALRILMGLGEGTTFPALSALLASWVPEKERSKVGSFVFGGGQIGTILGNFFSGLLLHYYDWHAVFYFFGGVSLIWFIAFALICYSNPEEHPFIKDEEREYLRAEMGQLKRNQDLPPTPWIAIITSVPMLALICAQIGHDWGFYIMVTDLPKYMADVLKVSVKNNGFYSSMPFFVMWIVSVTTGWLSDFLINRKFLTITGARKWFTGIAAVFPGIFIIGASYAGNNELTVVFLFTIAMGFMGTFYPGMKVNPLDLSPNYAGSLMAVTNGIGSMTGILAPYIVGVMTPNLSLEEWRGVFWITFVIFAVTTVVYSIWASGEVQPWNYPKNHQTTVEAGHVVEYHDDEKRSTNEKL